MPLGSSSEAVQEIMFHDSPEITAAVFPSFSKWHDHQTAICSIGRKENFKLKWKIAETYSDTFTQLQSTKPQLVYFYCHGGYDKDTPYIRVGSENSYEITPTDFTAYGVRWKEPQPIVFINGCHTLGMDPRLVLDFASTFVISLHASGVMGTEITIFEPLATDFAEEWLARFLTQGETAGEAILKTRLKLLGDGNPLGLVYNLYGNAYLKLRKEKPYSG